MHLRRKAAGLLAGVVLVAGGLLATAPAQAAPPPDRATSDTAATAPAAPAVAEAEVGVPATAPTISPAAERVRYVTDGTYTCPTGRLCARVWDPTQGKYKVFDLYYCNTYSLSYWGGGGDGGGFKNYQTNGTVARFYNSSGGVVHSRPRPTSPPPRGAGIRSGRSRTADPRPPHHPHADARPAVRGGRRGVPGAPLRSGTAPEAG